MTLAILIAIITLAIVLVLELDTLQRRQARAARVSSVKKLLSANQRDNQGNLHRIRARLSAPLGKGGSLDNLELFLSKDPGRREFARIVDRNRFNRYLEEDTREMIDTYMAQFTDEEAPNWAPEYVSTVRALFDAVKKDFLILSGVPAELTFMSVPSFGNFSIIENIQLALEDFANTWIPRNEISFSYIPDRKGVRYFLTESWRFQLRLDALDTSWKRLVASLYNLSIDSNWILATRYHPSLQTELNELIILFLSATIHWRGVDLLARIATADGELGMHWIPKLSYYKNIPELSGYTSDEEPTIFIARVNLGYTLRDVGTQTWLNQRKDWLTDYFNSFFSGIESSDIKPSGNVSRELFEWRTAKLKATAIHDINSKIVLEHKFGSRGIYGVRDLALLRANLFVDF